MTHLPEKAYKNLAFLNSEAARTVRLMCEYEEPRQRFLQQGIHDTIVFFGSARTRSVEDAATLVADAEARLAAHPNDAEAEAGLRHARAIQRLSPWYEAGRTLSKRLTQWSMYREHGRRYVVATGGGPGMMEAANRGAAEVEGSRNIGLGISLPFEPGVNGYVSKELAFEFHYFFMRKLWFMNLMRAMVVLPGGYGTLDELFECLTLLQTRKVKRDLPIVLLGTQYWNAVFNPEAMAEWGTISPRDVDMFYRTDSVDDAFDFLTKRLELAERHDGR
jgi:uncharacterized protein (TIGR00730 family)